MFEKYSNPETATKAYLFTSTGATKEISPKADTDENDIGIYVWDSDAKNPSELILLILRTDGKPTKRQLNAAEKWLKANYFNQAKLQSKSWKSGSNSPASAPLTDGTGLFVKMMKKSKVNQTKLDTGCAKVMEWLGAEAESKPADTKSGDGSKPAGDGSSKPADKGGSKPANNGGGTKPSGDGGTKPAPASFTYDDNAGGAANLDAFLSSRGWNLGGNK